MNCYTSGKHIELGLPPVNHDPKPWLSRTTGTLRYRVEPDDGWGYDYSRRPEFDVPANRILVELRQRAHSIGLAHAVAGALLDSVTHWWNGYTMAERSHAKRVLRKLEAQL